MASAWGKSWGFSWGYAWGADVAPTAKNSGSALDDRIPRVKLYTDDEAVLHVIMKFVTRNEHGNSF
jgi:hypothetical protein